MVCFQPGALSTGMSETFEIIDPVEKFVEAREAVSGGIESARRGRSIRTNRALWLAGAAVFAISTLILVHTLSPRVGDALASRLNKQSASDTGSDPQALILVAPPPGRTVHALEPEASAADRNSTVANGQLAEASSNPSDQVIPEADEARWVKTSLAAKVHSEPSISAPILTYYPAGTELRMAGRQNGWVQIVDPATSQRGWIYEIYLSPGEGPEQRQVALPQEPQAAHSEQPPAQAELETPDESGISAPDPSTPAAKSKEPRKYYGSNRHRSHRAIVIRFGFGRFWR
jgi:hypothetical protein